MDGAHDPGPRTTATEYLRATPGDAWRAVIDREVDGELASWLEAWIGASERGDLNSVLAAVHDEVSISQPEVLPDSKTYCGREGLIEAINDWPAQWETFTTRPVRAWEPAPGKLMLLATHKGRGAESGIEIEADVWWLFEFRDGLLSRWRMFLGEEDALSALAD